MQSTFYLVPFCSNCRKPKYISSSSGCRGGEQKIELKAPMETYMVAGGIRNIQQPTFII